jgi:hypothetical protein
MGTESSRIKESFVGKNKGGWGQKNAAIYKFTIHSFCTKKTKSESLTALTASGLSSIVNIVRSVNPLPIRRNVLIYCFII